MTVLTFFKPLDPESGSRGPLNPDPKHCISQNELDEIMHHSLSLQSYRIYQFPKIFKKCAGPRPWIPFSNAPSYVFYVKKIILNLIFYEKLLPLFVPYRYPGTYFLKGEKYGKLQNYLIYKIFWENVRICSSSRSWHFQNGKTQEPPKRGVPGLNFKASF